MNVSDLKGKLLDHWVERARDICDRPKTTEEKREFIRMRLGNSVPDEPGCKVKLIARAELDRNAMLVTKMYLVERHVIVGPSDIQLYP
jgi:hypothetical protein